MQNSTFEFFKGYFDYSLVSRAEEGEDRRVYSMVMDESVLKDIRSRYVSH